VSGKILRKCEALKTMTIGVIVFWDMIPYSLVEIFRCPNHNAARHTW